MTWSRRSLLTALGSAALLAAAARGQDAPVEPAAAFVKPAEEVQAPAAQPVPPKTPAVQPKTLPPATPPKTPPTPPPSPAADALAARASARGTAAEQTAFPTVFGDLPGGGALAGPLPTFVNANGQILGPTPVVVVLPDGRKVLLGPGAPVVIPPGGPVDELIRSRANPNAGGGGGGGGAGGQLVGLLPPPGTVFDPSLADDVARIPAYWRGAFKVTENGTPRPTTRAYLSYYYYDHVFNAAGGPLVPRVQLHQEIFGYEQAFADRQFSLEFRLPYTQLVSPGFYADTSLGDVTIISKAVLFENRESGDLLSAGLAVTVPTGTRPLASTTTGKTVRGTLLQPWVGHILTAGDWFTQGFNALVVPTDHDEVMFYSNDLAVGYFLYRCPGAVVSGVVPVFESHLNVPFNHHGARFEPLGLSTQLTLLGGLQLFLGEAATVGAAVGAPVTGPRPFSLQATVQMNWRF